MSASFSLLLSGFWFYIFEDVKLFFDEVKSFFDSSKFVDFINYFAIFSLRLEELFYFYKD